MADVEASGKTVDEAIEHALDLLHADDTEGRTYTRDDVSVEVLSEGRSGVLGVGGEEARVRIRPMSAVPAGVAVAPDGSHGSEDEAAEEGEEYVEDEAEVAAQALDQMLAIMGIEADVSIRDAETPGDGIGLVKAVLDIEGDDLGLLIGRRGETLASLQYLLNLMMMRRFGERMMFTVDVEGYRRRRERHLNSLAKRSADQVRRTRRPVTLDPMPPNERRIIHLALAEDRYVSTGSVGEGEDRKVCISPK